MCTSFLGQLMTATHNFGTAPIRAASTADTFKAALYVTTATVNAATTAYSATNEVSGTGYTAGGATLTISVVPTSSGTTSYLSFSNVSWTTATITARGALIYNSTPSANDNSNAALTNAAVCVLDFGGDKTSTAGDFTIIFPTFDATSAIIRIA